VIWFRFRGLCHFQHRLIRKVFAYTVALFLNLHLGRPHLPSGADVMHQNIDEGRRPLIIRHTVQDTGAQRFCDLLQDLLLGSAIDLGAGLLQVLFKWAKDNERHATSCL
jgi:hypothetical protein